MPSTNRRTGLIGLIVMVACLTFAAPAYAFAGSDMAPGASAQAEDGPGPAIRIRAATELEMEREITIGDIAEFRGFQGGETDEIRSLRLGDAPERGESRVFTNTGLSEVLRAHLPKLQAGRSDKIVLSIPPRVVVTRRVFKLEARDVETEIRKQLQAICAECEFEISRLSLPILPEGLAAKTEWSLRLRPEMPKGSFSVPVEVGLRGQKRNVYWISGDIRIYRRVPVATRTLELGEALRSSDFVIERRDVTFQNDSYPAEGELQGAVAARSIAAAQVIGRSWIRRQAALRAGELVRVTAGDESWTVTVEGVAQQTGFIGDLVRVKIPSTQKIVSGILRDKGVVEVR